MNLRRLYRLLLALMVALAIVMAYLTYHTFWGRLA